MPHLGLILIVAAIASGAAFWWWARVRKRAKQRATRRARREMLDRQWRERTGQVTLNEREP